LQASETFAQWIKPQLRKTDLQDISHFETFIRSENSLAYFMGISNAYSKPDQGVKALQKAVNTAIAAVKKEPQQVERILIHFENTQKLFSTLDLGDQYTFLDSFLGKLEIDSSDYDTSIANHEAFINTASAIPTFQSHLATKSSDEKGLFLKFSMTKGGHDYLMKAIEIHGNNPAKIMEVVNDSISCQKMGNTQYLPMTFAYLHRVAQILNRLQPEHTFDFFEAWVKNSTELEPDQFDHFIQQYTRYLEMIEKLQTAKPKIFEQGSKEQSDLRLSSMNLFNEYATQMRRLSLFDIEKHVK
jgi:hypothetical protein